MRSWDLKPGYRLVELSDEDFFPRFRAARKELFGDLLEADVLSVLSEEELAKRKALGQRLRADRFFLQLGLFHGQDFVGWTCGQQLDRERFYMVNSAIYPEHRGQGLYSAMLQVLMELVREAGFQVVFSRHQATNNAVLVPKLKAGFVLTGFELHDAHGVVVTLSWYTNPARRKLLDFRAGRLRPDPELQALLGLS